MLTFVAQKKHNHCHIAVVLMLIKSINKNIKYNDIKNSISGCSFYDIKKELNKYNIKAISYKIDKNKLKHTEFKFMIVHLKRLLGNHLIILEKNNKKIFYYDPSKSHRKRFNKFILNSMSGNVMIIENINLNFNCYKRFAISYNFKLIFSIFILFLIIILFLYYLK